MIEIDVAIIGGGLSGLHTAYELQKRGINFRLFEARERLGGRVHTVAHGSSQFDIGPSWFWPGQPEMIGLVNELGLRESVFEQYSTGDSLYESQQAPIQRGVTGITMAGSYRLNGGLKTLIDNLAAKVLQNIRTATPITSLRLLEEGVELESSIGKVCAAKVVIALPPRVALQSIKFSPALSDQREKELQSVSTWMAGHAKAILVYPKPFWREAGLSGDVISQRGPLSEIHDASPQSGEHFALFGFFATPPKYRSDDHGELASQIISQLVRLFGTDAESPSSVQIKDWARDQWVATERDQLILNHHPMNHLSSTLESAWFDRLQWSGSETAQGHFNGYLEGALLASRQSLKQLSA